MKLGVAFASLFTLGILGVFLFIISSLVFYFGDLYNAFGFAGLFALEAILFFLSWRLGPWVSDHVYEWFYKLKWVSPEELAKMDPKLREFLQKTCADEKIALPRFGIIDDDNPQAFTYGSDHWNARMVLTKGIFTFLDSEERKAVVAHELGHIVHRDFIVMNLAAFILTVLYTLGRTLIRTGGSGSKKDKNPLPAIGFLSLVFYYIGTYLLLFLSRTREYWADEYSKEKVGSGNPLSTALVKIAYGIVTSADTEKTKELMEGTRTLGIYDHKRSKVFGLVGIDYVKNKDANVVTSAMVFDTRNLWAFFQELSSSHPLTGKRIKALLYGEKKPVFDMQAVLDYPFDTARHYREFLTDVLMSKLWVFVLLSGIVLTLFYAFAFTIVLLPLGLAMLLSAYYMFPSGPMPQTTIDDLMADPYASPVRGKPARLTGTLLGKGIPGYAFSEDFMFQDKSGLLYVDYQSWIPLVGNFLFAITKANQLVGQKATAQGWFFRGASQHMTLDSLVTPIGQFKSRQRFFAYFWGAAVLVVGLLLFVFKPF